jgi:putative ABC transport system permease protein
MNWLRQAVMRGKIYDDLAEEVRLHLEEKTEKLIEGGMDRKQAEFQAKREFGNAALIEERSREVWQWPTLESLSADVKLTAYQLRKAPVFTMTVIATLALGIGANTAIFSVIDAVLLKPFGYPNPDRIVQFLLTFPQGPRPGSSISNFRLWREQKHAFQDVSAYDFGGAGLNLTGDVPEQVRGVHVSVDYFRLFGAPMLLGRTFSTEEASPSGGKVVVISYGLWKSRFNSDPRIVGKMISLENEPYTVLGVTGQDFHSDPVADLWIPFQFALNTSDPTHYFQVAGRLKDGITLEQANAQLKLAAAEARRSYSVGDSNLGFLGFEVKPLRDMIVGDVQSSLLVMAVAVGFVLLIACANVANLLLVRATGRKHEFAIRAALGAPRIRIFRQLLTESVVLFLIGGALGIVIGLAGVRTLLTVSPADIPRIGQGSAFIAFDWHILAFAIGLSVFTGILFGLVPAVSASRPDLNSTLKESGNQQGGGVQQNRARSLFVIGEMSLAVVLLIGAALMIRTFIALHEVDRGFDPHNVLTIDMSLAGSRFAKTADVSSFVNTARLRINAIAGVENSAMTCSPPFTTGRLGLPFVAVSRSLGSSSSTGDAQWMAVSPGYFDVFKIPILRGRGFTAQDNESAPPVVLINEAMAKRFWPNQNPLGNQITIGENLGPRYKDVPRQIIGIVGNTRDVDLSRPPAPAMMIPQAQESDNMTAFGLHFGPAYWLVRTRVDPHQVGSIVVKQLSDASGGLPVGHIRSMDEVMSGSISRQNFNMLLLTIFAASALVLAIVGIYGVISYSIAQRRREIGVRMALGAGRTNIRNLVLRQGMLLAIIGVSIGVSAAFGSVRFLASFLFSVTTWDPVVFLSVPLLLLCSALLAVWLPARRATRVDPMQALRSE